MTDQTITLPPHLSEEWRPVPGAPGYEVSNLGRARSYRDKGGRVTDAHHPVGEARDRQGYHVFKVGRSEGVWRVHRAVLHAFVGPPAEGEVGRHLNDEKSDNRLENLAWGTHQDNSDDRVRNGKARGGTLAGEDLPHSKLNWESVREIRRRRAEGASLKELSSYYGVSISTISLIHLGQIWKEG